MRICSLICSLTHNQVTSIEMARIKIRKNYPSMEDPIIKAYFCVDCGKCVEVCPFDVIWLNKKEGKVFKCDLCNGDPECVKWCPHEALEFEK